MTLQGNESKQQKLLRAAVERRDRLWAQLRAQHPTFTQTELEMRLEQFGA